MEEQAIQKKILEQLLLQISLYTCSFIPFHSFSLTLPTAPVVRLVLFHNIKYKSIAVLEAEHNSWKKRSMMSFSIITMWMHTQKMYMVLITTFTKSKVSIWCQPHACTHALIQASTYALNCCKMIILTLACHNTIIFKWLNIGKWNHVYLWRFGKQFYGIYICIPHRNTVGKITSSTV